MGRALGGVAWTRSPPNQCTDPGPARQGGGRSIGDTTDCRANCKHRGYARRRKNRLFALGAPGGQWPRPVRWRRRPRTDKVQQLRTGARELIMRCFLLSIGLLAGMVVV